VRLKAIATLGVFSLLTALVAAQAVPSPGASQQGPRVTSWPREGPPRPLPAHPVVFPPYEIRKLANGLQVVLVNHNEQPSISVRLIIRAGAAQDPKDKYGMARRTATLLDQGAGARSAEQIADTIDFVGGALGTGAGSDLSFVNAVVMKDSYDLALELMADVVQRPTFAPDEIERQRQQALSALKVSADDPEAVAGQVIDRLIYGFHPYGMPGGGTAASLASLTRADFVDYHQKYFVPNNALITVVGDLGPGEALVRPQKYLRGRKPRGRPAQDGARTPPTPTPAVCSGVLSRGMKACGSESASVMILRPTLSASNSVSFE